MQHNAPDYLTIDSEALLSPSRSVREPEKRFNKVYLAAILEYFDDGRLTAVNWCPDTKLLADAFTKDSKKTADLLLHALCSGKHERLNEMKSNLSRPPSSHDHNRNCSKGTGGVKQLTF